MNAIVLSPDEQMLYVNSGSRTDHGEVQNGNGQFPDAREVPLTSMIIRVPADSKNLSLPNNADAAVCGRICFCRWCSEFILIGF